MCVCAVRERGSGVSECMGWVGQGGAGRGEAEEINVPLPHRVMIY